MPCDKCGLDQVSCTCNQAWLGEFHAATSATEPAVTQVNGSPALKSEEGLAGALTPPEGSSSQSFPSDSPSPWAPPLWPPPPSASTPPDWLHDSHFSQIGAAPPGPPGGWQQPPSGHAISKTAPAIRGPIWIVTAAVAIVVVALAAGGLGYVLGTHSKGRSTPPGGAPASPALATGQQPVPTGSCTQAPVSLDSPAGSPSAVAGQTAASVADTIVRYASEELNPDALYYRLQNVTPAEGASLLAASAQTLGDQATEVTTATFMTPGGEDDNLAVYRFADPTQATALVRTFWDAGCTQQTHVDVFNGAVGAYLSEQSPGAINFSTAVVVAVGLYTVVYRQPGQLPASITQPMVT